MKKFFVLAVVLILALAMTTVAIAENPVKLLVNGQEVKSDANPVLQSGRVLVPVRAVAEALGFEVTWDEANNAVIIKRNSGDNYLRGKNDPKQTKPSINTNFIKSSDLKAILDDDKDNDLCDYREGRSGGDKIENDPLVVDVRQKKDFDAGHIPGAIFIAPAEEIASAENLAALKKALADHVAKGGVAEIVLYCYTGHTAGLAAGVLGDMGFNVKNMRFGYNIAWEDGTRTPDKTILGPREDKDGKPVPYNIKL